MMTRAEFAALIGRDLESVRNGRVRYYVEGPEGVGYVRLQAGARCSTCLG